MRSVIFAVISSCFRIARHESVAVCMQPWGKGTAMYLLQHGSLLVTTFIFLMVRLEDTLD